MTTARLDELAAFHALAPSGIKIGETPLPEWKMGLKKRSSAPAWAEEIAEIFGKAHERTGFWSPWLSAHAYPVAKCRNGDPVVLVVGGRFRGHVLRTNHESYHGFFEHLATLGGPREDPEFLEQAQAVLRKAGYRGGEPSTDQVMAVLLHKSFDGATRLATSFADFYAALWSRQHPKKPRSSLPSLEDVPSDSEEARRITAAEGCVASLGLQGKALERLEAGLRAAEIRRLAGVARTPSGLYVADNQQLWRSTDEGHTFNRCAAPLQRISSLSHDGAEGLWVAGRHESGATTFTHTNDGNTFTSLRHPTVTQWAHPLGPTTQGVLAVVGNQLCALHVKSGISSLGTPDQANRRIYAVVETSRGSLLAATVNVSRSTDGGQSWKPARLPQSPHREVIGLVALSSGLLVAFGNVLLVSRDDGVSFTAAAQWKRKLGESLRAAFELNGALFLWTGARVYRVVLAA